jgi:uncharacterized membrane protein YgcG
MTAKRIVLNVFNFKPTTGKAHLKYRGSSSSSSSNSISSSGSGSSNSSGFGGGGGVTG